MSLREDDKMAQIVIWKLHAFRFRWPCAIKAAERSLWLEVACVSNIQQQGRTGDDG